MKRLYWELKEHRTPTLRAELCDRVEQRIRQIQSSVKLGQSDPATTHDHEYSFQLTITHLSGTVVTLLRDQTGVYCAAWPDLVHAAERFEFLRHTTTCAGSQVTVVFHIRCSLCAHLPPDLAPVSTSMRLGSTKLSMRWQPGQMRVCASCNYNRARQSCGTIVWFA